MVGHCQKKIDKACETIPNLERGKTALKSSKLADFAAIFKALMREFFEGMDEQLSGERKPLLTRLNLLAGSMDDQTLELFLKLGDVLVEEKANQLQK